MLNLARMRDARIMKIMADVELLKPPELLLIDDDPRILDGLTRVLGSAFVAAGIEVDILYAETTEKGLSIMSAEATTLPDGAIVDGLDGGCWEILQRASELGVPAILYSGNSDYISRAEQTGIPAQIKGQSLSFLKELMRKNFSFMRPHLIEK
ncbi:hypothetical protein BH10PAT3_BH10PAT3_4270 [soil metagenome]